jgi:hypothetical protein
MEEIYSVSLELGELDLEKASNVKNSLLFGEAIAEI